MQLVSTVYAGELPTHEGTGVVALYALDNLFANVVGAIMPLAGIALFIMLIIGGFQYITGGGDPKKMEGARNTLTFAVAGIILVAASYLIIVFIDEFTGVDLSNFRVYLP